MNEEQSGPAHTDSVMDSRVQASAKTRVGCVAFTFLVLACSCGPSERAESARKTAAGTSVAALIDKAGQPTVDRPVKPGTYPADACADDQRNVRAFEYHVPFDPVTGPVRKLFHRPTVA